MAWSSQTYRFRQSVHKQGVDQRRYSRKRRDQKRKGCHCIIIDSRQNVRSQSGVRHRIQDICSQDHLVYHKESDGQRHETDSFNRTGLDRPFYFCQQQPSQTYRNTFQRHIQVRHIGRFFTGSQRLDCSISQFLIKLQQQQFRQQKQLQQRKFKQPQQL